VYKYPQGGAFVGKHSSAIQKAFSQTLSLKSESVPLSFSKSKLSFLKAY